MSKNIILSFDGTWNTPDTEGSDDVQVETNARRIFEAAASNESNGKQVAWYDEGVGTNWYDRIRGGAFGYGLSENIRQGYRKLVETYEDGDQIFLFGFSRGAYTARSLSGMIRNCGILRRENEELVDEAYEIYRTRDGSADSDAAVYFRDNFAQTARINFIGVWDTVGALGIPLKAFKAFNRQMYEFHDTRLSGIVDHAYQALAIDEHREDFQAAIWDPRKVTRNQTVEQQWFVGAHTDVGGGHRERELSDISLQWMASKAKKAGLKLDKHVLPADVSKNYTGKYHDSFDDFLGGAYKLFKNRHYRSMMQTVNGNEGIHQSVAQRYETLSDYNPKNAVDIISNME